MNLRQFTDEEVLFLRSVLENIVVADAAVLELHPHLSECPSCRIAFATRSMATLSLYNKLGEFITC